MAAWRWRNEGSLVTKECTTVNYVSGPLIFVQKVKGVSYGEMVEIDLPNGERRTGQVLDISEESPSSRSSRGRLGRH